MNRNQIKELLENPAHRSFIEAHLKEDYPKLLLRYSKDPLKRSLIEQIAQKQRIRKKLPTYYSRSDLYLAPSLNLSQSSSEETAALKAKWIGEASSFCDLSAGFGIDFQAFASKHSINTYVEPNPSLLEIARYNLEQLKLPVKDFINQSATEALALIDKQDFIYLDPSRRDENQRGLIQIEDYQPNLLHILASIQAKCQKLLVKLSPMISIPDYLKKLEGLNEVWVISQRNECKEVCFLFDFNQHSSLKTRTVNLETKGESYFEFHTQASAQVTIGAVQDYIYIPNASVLKANGQDHLAEQFELQKLDFNSNVFSSSRLIENYPGKVFQCLIVDKPYAKNFHKKELNVVSRNFPDSAEFIAKKLKIKKSSQDQYLIATQNQQKAIFILAKQLL